MDRHIELIDYRRLSRKRIILIAESISHAYARLEGDMPANYFAINFDVVYNSLIYPEYAINLEEGDDLGSQDDVKILGAYGPSTNTICLDAVLNDENDPLHHKKGFTFWHELGHAILHGEWLRTNPGTGEGRQVTVENSLSSTAEKRMEQQANLFASRAAIPQWFLNFVLESTFGLNRPIRYVGPATYQLFAWGVRNNCYVDSFHELCISIAYRIRSRFNGMSIESIANRVQESDFVVDLTDRTDRVGGSTPLFRTCPVSSGAALATA
jgi:IrrE N-terminal-like domain